VLAGGLPASPCKKELLAFLAQEGYWAFYPRYRGAWESDGLLLEHSPVHDICDVITDLFEYGGVTDLMSDTRFTLEPDELHVIGSSFGGTAALFASSDSRMTSATALSPVIDWRIESEAEPTRPY